MFIPPSDTSITTAIGTHPLLDLIPAIRRRMRRGIRPYPLSLTLQAGVGAEELVDLGLRAAQEIRNLSIALPLLVVPERELPQRIVVVLLPAHADGQS